MPYFSPSESTAVSYVGYNDEKHELCITFRDSEETYAYLGFPKQEYEDLLKAESIGRFVSERIKPHYKFQLMKTV